MRRRRESGVVFVFCLLLVVTLVGVVAAAAITARNNTSAAIGRTEKARCERMIEAGIQRAITQLTTPVTTTSTTVSAEGAPTLLTDPWAELGSNGDEEFVVGDGSFRLQIVDASSFLNINSLTQAQLEKLPLSTQQVESLLDYRETSRTPRALGAKDEYYNDLAKPYNAKLRDFETFDELLQVKDFTYNTLYTETDGFSGNNLIPGLNGAAPVLSNVLTAYSFSPVRNAQGEALINVNAAGTTIQRLTQAPASLPIQLATQIAARKDWPGIGDIVALPNAQATEVRRRILDNLTTTNANRLSGKLNLNTATESTLSGIADLTPDLVQALLQRQTQGFNTLGDLADIPGLTGTALQNSVDKLTVASQTFLVRVEGRSGTTTQVAIATIDLLDGVPKVTQVSPVPYDDYVTRWEWPEDPTRTTTLKEKS